MNDGWILDGMPVRLAMRPAAGQKRWRRCPDMGGPPATAPGRHARPGVADRAGLFSRDCPLYQLRLPGGAELFVLLNHLKSQSFAALTQAYW